MNEQQKINLIHLYKIFNKKIKKDNNSKKNLKKNQNRD